MQMRIYDVNCHNVIVEAFIYASLVCYGILFLLLLLRGIAAINHLQATSDKFGFI